MTEVLLLLVALLLSLACGAFVAAEFSLTTVERADLEESVERGDRGAAERSRPYAASPTSSPARSSASPSPT